MINKKICMVGASAVGKSALVQQYVHSIFSDNYLSTVGVKTSKKDLKLDGTDVSLLLWDLEGKDLYLHVDVNISYLRGAMGYFLVVDGKRRDTLKVALELRNLAVDLLGPKVPHYFLLNKADLEQDWEVNKDDLELLHAQGFPFLKTSAKTGQGVEEAFTDLTRVMLLQEDSSN